MQHCLLTLSFYDDLVHLHGYLMTNDKRDVTRALNKLTKIADTSAHQLFPVVLQTGLAAGVDLVRELISGLSEEIKQNLKTAKDFHLSVFTTPVGHPDDTRLMELH